ncbi:MAG: thioesterase family protein [Nitriliruptorales bacterium]|nr:thioesterase family protein [Nitriliruptorales bacterium]
MGELDPGLSHTQEIEVTDEQTAVALGSGDVPVLATPAVLALAEGACVHAIADQLPDDQTSVGTFAEIDHEKATPVGGKVTVEATLVGHHGRRLEFNVFVREGDEVAAKVRHRRVLVDRQRFLERVGISE